MPRRQTPKGQRPQESAYRKAHRSAKLAAQATNNAIDSVV
jgi:hypothetical protein